MKYSVAKNENNEFVIKEIIDFDGKGCNNDFDYAKMIKFLFKNNGNNLEIEYDKNITDDEKNKIHILFEEIKKIFLEKDKTDISKE